MSFAEPNNGIIVQSGTDNNLSDLANNSGVTTTVDAGITFYDFGTNRMQVHGTVHQDPEKEVCIFHDESTESASPADTVLSLYEHSTLTPRAWKNPSDITKNSDGSIVFTAVNHGMNVGDAIRTRIINNSNLDGQKLRIDAVTTDTFTIGRGYYYTQPDANTESNTHVPWGQFTRIPCWNYGAEINKSGRTRYSVGCGLIFSGGSTSNWDPDEYSFSVGTAFFWSRGGTIITNRPFSLGGGYDSKGTTWASPRKTSGGAYSPVEIRSMGSGFFTDSKLVNVSGIDVRYTKDMTVQLEGGALSEVLGSWWEVSLKDFDVSGNANDVDIGHDGSGSHHHHDYEILNSANGSNIIAMWRPVQRTSTAQRGVVATKKEVSFSIKDASNNPIEGVEMYVVDNPSTFAKKGTFAPGSSQGAYTKTPTLLNGVINNDGSITYDYLDPISYSGTTDSSGVISTIKVLTSIQIKEYNANHPDSFFPNTTLPEGVTENRYHGEFGYVISKRPNGAWRYSETNNNGPSFSDWDSDEFGGFYKVDRRSNDNTDADEFTFKFCSYGHSLSSSTQALRGTGELVVNWTLFDDLNIVDSKASVEAYTDVSTPQEFYDAAKLHLVNNYSGELSTIVTRSGNEINAGSYNVHINKDATDVFAFDGTTITIKTDTFIGDIVTTGTTTVESDEVVIGNFGSIGVLAWEVKNIEATSRLQLYNVTKDTEVLTVKLDGTAGELVDTDGTYTSAEIAVGDVVRLRVTCVVGATAMLPLVTTGVATTAGLAFSINQLADTVYNINAIDGSAISSWTADFTNNPMGVDLSESDGGASVQEIYAFMVYSQTTADGVDKWFNVVTAIDGSNYQIDDTIADIKIQNIGTVAVNISGGRIFRKDGSSVLFAEDGDKPLTLDTGALVANIQPQMEEVLNNNSKLSTINNNSKLIPGLL